MLSCVHMSGGFFVKKDSGKGRNPLFSKVMVYIHGMMRLGEP